MPDFSDASNIREPDILESFPDDRTVWRNLLAQLPRRATMAFALRCAKRVEPVARYHTLFAEASSVGLSAIPNLYLNASAAAQAATDAGAAASTDDAVRVLDGAADAISSAAGVSWSAETNRAAAHDIKTFRALNLGTFGELGVPIRWDDARLGPLWPDGEPTWYAEMVQKCRELERKLLTFPDPNRPPLDPEIIARLHVRDELDRMYRDGLFAQYAGGCIIFAGGQIRGHGTTLVEAHRDAVGKHPEIDPDDFIDYYIPLSE